jgi:RNA polymerase sigma-70 factor (ECF subfamily)
VLNHPDPSATASESDALARALYTAHGAALTAWARRRFGDPHTAEEVVQEVVLAGWRNYDQYDPERGSERAWMFGIARNVAATRHRRDRRHLRSIPTGADLDDSRDDTNLARLVDRSLISDAVRSLSADHRTVLIAAYWERMTTKEIAERLGIPDGTVKSRLHYAMRMLRTALDEREVL